MAFVFKIKIDGSSKPPIWRKVKVNENTLFADLHDVIQRLFGWSNYHMFMYVPKGWGSRPEISLDFEDDLDFGITFSKKESFPNGDKFRAEEIKLSDYFSTQKQKITYIYDFGDEWKHIIELIEITDETVLHPICLGAKGANLIEDCGGIYGYYNMVDILDDPEHYAHQIYMDRVGLKKGQKIDIESFDLEQINKDLSRL